MGNRLSAVRGVENQILVRKLFSAETVAASGSATSDALTLHNRTGIFSIQYTFTGTGTAKLEYLVSLDGVTYTDPSGASDIASGLSAGTDVVSFEPILAPFIKIKITETGGANAVVFTSLYLAVQ